MLSLPSSGIRRAGGGRGVALLADIPNPGDVQPMKRQTQAVLLAERLLSALRLKLESVRYRI